MRYFFFTLLLLPVGLYLGALAEQHFGKNVGTYVVMSAISPILLLPLLAVVGLFISSYYIIRRSYQYEKSTQFYALLIIALLSAFTYFCISITIQRNTKFYQYKFSGSSRHILNQLNLISLSSDKPELEINKLINEYNSSNNTLKVTRIIKNENGNFSTTSDRDGLGNPVINFKLINNSESELHWSCTVVNYGTFEKSKFNWCKSE